LLEAFFLSIDIYLATTNDKYSNWVKTIPSNVIMINSQLCNWGKILAERKKVFILIEIVCSNETKKIIIGPRETDVVTMSKFDLLSQLLNFGLDHVVEGILELLPVEDIAAVQLVSKLWSVVFALVLALYFKSCFNQFRILIGSFSTKQFYNSRSDYVLLFVINFCLDVSNRFLFKSY